MIRPRLLSRASSGGRIMEAEWMLTWRDGSHVLVCSEHLGKRNRAAPATEYPPYCSEVKWRPDRKTPECGDCYLANIKAATPTGDSDAS